MSSIPIMGPKLLSEDPAVFQKDPRSPFDPASALWQDRPTWETKGGYP